MTFDEWVKKNLGKYIDYDEAYGVQCVDLIKSYIKNVLCFTPESIGNAINYFNNYSSSSYLQKHFTRIHNTTEFIPKRGDIGVFKTSSGKGHVVICTGDGTTSWFTDYEQNTDGKGSEMKLVKRGYQNFLGVLRPKNQNNLGSIRNTKFDSNATIKNSTDVYCDSKLKSNIGYVWTKERVRILKTDGAYSFIQYAIANNEYKIGIIESKNVVKD